MENEANRVQEWDARYSAVEPHVTADGVELYYELRGQGPPLTIVSNYFIVSVAWRPFTTELVQGHQILTYDLRNQGASSTAEGTLTAHVDDLESLLDALEIDQTYLLGHSVSARVCGEFILAHPARVKGVVFLAPSLSPWGAKRRSYLLRSWLKGLERDGPEGLFELFFPLVFTEDLLNTLGTPAYLALKERFLALNSPEQLRRNISGALDAEVKAQIELDRIACPALLATGDQDFLNSELSMRRMAEVMSNASLRIIKDAGHTPYFEQPLQFQRMVADFIAEQESRE
jgi:3-oxoadipate enol-lactonase